ncbi:hypothetical protein N5I36_03070, partial [Klebsiella aerogenes]|uniref:hypothetical protein n=1 Tax=Klebsiella aerogenes TaxID=548 RepID=UPI0022472CC4
CQASNKKKGSVERLGLLFYLLFVGERSPEQDKSAGSGFERCAATARRVAGRTPAIIARHQIKRKTGPFVFVFCGQARRHLPWWRCAYRGYRPVARERRIAPPPGKWPYQYK